LRRVDLREVLPRRHGGQPLGPGLGVAPLAQTGGQVPLLLQGNQPREAFIAELVYLFLY
jgi:hypothetical protein